MSEVCSGCPLSAPGVATEMLRELGGINASLTGMREAQDKIDKFLHGNGTPGVEQRLGALERSDAVNKATKAMWGSLIAAGVTVTGLILQAIHAYNSVHK